MSRIGRTVLYTLSEQDVREIMERRRLVGAAIARGNEPRRSQDYPAIIVADFGASVNLRVMLDGHEEHWATSRAQLDPEQHFVWIYPVLDAGDFPALRGRTLSESEQAELPGPNDVGGKQLPTLGREKQVVREFHWVPLESDYREPRIG